MKPSSQNTSKASHANLIVIAAGTTTIRYDRPDEPYAALPWEDRDALSHAILGDLAEQAVGLPHADVVLVHPDDQRFDDVVELQRERIRAVSVPRDQGEAAVVQALDDPTFRAYQKILLVLEQTPLLDSRLFARIIAQLGAEDESIVVGLTRDGAAAVLGFRAVHLPAVLELDSQTIGRSDRLLEALCGVNAVVMPLPVVDGLRTGAQMELLRDTLGTLDRTQSAFPRRTEAVFRTLDKKYKPRKSP